MSQDNPITANNWKIEKDDNDIAWVHFDTPGTSANLLSQVAIKELEDIIKDFEKDLPKAVIILSDKKDSFIFGADIKEFTALETKEQALEFMHKGHALKPAGSFTLSDSQHGPWSLFRRWYRTVFSL